MVWRSGDNSKPVFAMQRITFGVTCSQGYEEMCIYVYADICENVQIDLFCPIMSIFAFLADFMITEKLFMQRVWMSGVELEEEINDDLYKYRKWWNHELPSIESFNMDRC